MDKQLFQAEVLARLDRIERALAERTSVAAVAGDGIGEMREDGAVRLVAVDMPGGLYDRYGAQLAQADAEWPGPAQQIFNARWFFVKAALSHATTQQQRDNIEVATGGAAFNQRRAVVNGIDTIPDAVAYFESDLTEVLKIHESEIKRRIADTGSAKL